MLGIKKTFVFFNTSILIFIKSEKIEILLSIPNLNHRAIKEKYFVLRKKKVKRFNIYPKEAKKNLILIDTQLKYEQISNKSK
ncbi:hypothetical protein GLOIN_2v591429 [Rhizophagus irregularis DAOM 181602=DAOM 197198]|nr:hypothetical protein GLOIN_2v591429 [Rhizophagus irregularis DAOM 181602=DAOM 197198]